MTHSAPHTALTAALQWQVENGVTVALSDTPTDKTCLPPPVLMAQEAPVAKPIKHTSLSPASEPMGSVAARLAAEDAALKATNIDELASALRNFDGLAIRSTATNCVFADGNPQADIMVIGEVPGAEEDEQGKSFVDTSGQFLDTLLQYIGLHRHNTDPHTSLYFTNIVNWRPPGNRTPTPQEMDISLPFIERHIALVKPKILLLIDKAPTQSLLRTTDGIMKTRGDWHNYTPTHKDNQDLLGNQPILALPLFHPSFLLRTPNHKKTMWFDILTLQQKREELGLCAKM